MDKKKPVGIDRIIRGIIGALLITAGFFDFRGAHLFFWALGSMMLITVVTGVCAFGSSCAVAPAKVSVKKEDAHNGQER